MTPETPGTFDILSTHLRAIVTLSDQVHMYSVDFGVIQPAYSASIFIILESGMLDVNFNKF